MDKRDEVVEVTNGRCAFCRIRQMPLKYASWMRPISYFDFIIVGLEELLEFHCFLQAGDVIRLSF